MYECMYACILHTYTHAQAHAKIGISMPEKSTQPQNVPCMILLHNPIAASVMPQKFNKVFKTV